MEFKLVKDVPERPEDYREVFYSSRLYNAYFADDDRLNGQLHKTMVDGNLYMVTSPKDEAMGIMYITQDGIVGLSYLDLLNVGRKHRDKGVGTDLVKIFIGVIEREQYPSMYIVTSQFSTGVEQSHQSLGFQPRCPLHGAFRKGISEWLFMRPNRKLA